MWWAGACPCHDQQHNISSRCSDRPGCYASKLHSISSVAARLCRHRRMWMMSTACSCCCAGQAPSPGRSCGMCARSATLKPKCRHVTSALSYSRLLKQTPPPPSLPTTISRAVTGGTTNIPVSDKLLPVLVSGCCCSDTKQQHD